jgi:hypothetical protein
MRIPILLAVAIASTACGAAMPAPSDPPPVGPGPTAGACKSVATFTSSAAPQLQQDGCAGCHAGADAPATAAFNLTNLGKDNAAACSHALHDVNLANRPQSAIIQAAAGAQAHKGGKVADTRAFTNALLGWINNE